MSKIVSFWESVQVPLFIGGSVIVGVSAIMAAAAVSFGANMALEGLAKLATG